MDRPCSHWQNPPRHRLSFPRVVGLMSQELYWPCCSASLSSWSWLHEQEEPWRWTVPCSARLVAVVIFVLLLTLLNKSSCALEPKPPPCLPLISSLSVFCAEGRSIRALPTAPFLPSEVCLAGTDQAFYWVDGNTSYSSRVEILFS